jgi:hypothetical protein
MKKAFTFLLIFISFSGISQREYAPDPINPNEPSLSYVYVMGGTYKLYKEIAGSPYVTDEFADGECVSPGGRVFKNQHLRFNTYTGELEYLENGSVYILQSAISSFVIKTDDENYVFKNGFMEVGLKPSLFFQVIYEGKVKLLKLHKTEIKETLDRTGGFAGYKYVNKSQFFLIDEKGKVSDFNPKSATDYLTLAQTKKEKVEEFISSKKIKFKNTGQMWQVLAYIDTTN